MAKFPDLKHLECLAWAETERILSKQKRKIWMSHTSVDLFLQTWPDTSCGLSTGFSFAGQMLTEEYGRLSFMVRVPKTSKGRLKRQLFQPLSVLRLVFDYRQRANLQHLRDVQVALPFSSIPFEPLKSSVSLFLAEFLYHATRGEQRNTSLYNYIAKSLEWFDGVEHSFANFHLVFMMRLSRFIGFYPNLDDYAKGYYFDLRAAAFVATAPVHPDFLQPSEAAHITTLMRMDYETMHLFRLSRQERNRITDCLVEYYRHHVPGFPELRSLAVLRETAE